MIKLPTNMKNKIDNSDLVESKVVVDKISLSEILKAEINANFISFNLNNYYSRAPPK